MIKEQFRITKSLAISKLSIKAMEYFRDQNFMAYELTVNNIKQIRNCIIPSDEAIQKIEELAND